MLYKLNSEKNVTREKQNLPIGSDSTNQNSNINFLLEPMLYLTRYLSHMLCEKDKYLRAKRTAALFRCASMDLNICVCVRACMCMCVCA